MPNVTLESTPQAAEEATAQIAGIPPGVPPPNRPNLKVPAKTKLAWSIAGVVDNWLINGVNGLAQPIYTIALGVNPVFLGYALAIPRLLDAFIDPYIGFYSDNHRTRWGRRRHLIALGALGMGIFFSLIWTPFPKMSHNGLFIYFSVMCLLFYLSYSLFTIP
jgi:glycoside/pentoside/hexuronide:cation symporter, GPH family